MRIASQERNDSFRLQTQTREAATGAGETGQKLGFKAAVQTFLASRPGHEVDRPRTDGQKEELLPIIIR
jgi:hypothetical protein